MRRLGRGWQLTKLSFRVIKKDKEILLFPVISGLVLISLLASFMGSWLFLNGFQFSNITSDWTFYIFWIAFYFVGYFVVIFFNVAMVACATKRLEGGDPTVRYGLGFAAGRLKYILQWALFAATVGLILRALSEKAGFLGKLIIGLVGAAWSIATYFVVPIIAFEEVGPLKAIKSSLKLLRGTWGEALISNLGLGLVFILLGIVGVLPLFIAIVIGSVELIIVTVVAVVVYWIILAVLATAANQVLMAALYRYAKTGQIPDLLPPLMVKNPWQYGGRN